MFKNRTYNIIVLVGVVIIIFDLSYLGAFNKYRRVQGSSNQTSDYNIFPKDFERPVLNNNSKQDETVSSDASMIFVMKNNKTNWTYTASEKKVPQELIGKKGSEMENLYADKGYKLESMTPQKLIFLKEVDGYSFDRNKYVLGVYDGYIAIYKIDNSGKLYIEDEANDISKVRKVKEFPQDFQEILLKGSSELQFDSKQIARDYLNGCIS